MAKTEPQLPSLWEQSGGATIMSLRRDDHSSLVAARKSRSRARPKSAWRAGRGRGRDGRGDEEGSQRGLGRRRGVEGEHVWGMVSDGERKEEYVWGMVCKGEREGGNVAGSTLHSSQWQAIQSFSSRAETLAFEVGVLVEENPPLDRAKHKYTNIGIDEEDEEEDSADVPQRGQRHNERGEEVVEAADALDEAHHPRKPEDAEHFDSANVHGASEEDADRGVHKGGHGDDEVEAVPLGLPVDAPCPRRRLRGVPGLRC